MIAVNRVCNDIPIHLHRGVVLEYEFPLDQMVYPWLAPEPIREGVGGGGGGDREPRPVGTGYVGWLTVGRHNGCLKVVVVLAEVVVVDTEAVVTRLDRHVHAYNC